MGAGRHTMPAVLAAAVLLACGCASVPASEPPASEAHVSGPAAAVVPAIADPREARNQDPCTVLTAERLGRSGLAGTGTPTGPGPGPGCTWQGAGGLVLTVALYTQGGGLATLAANSEPTTTRVRLDGYPALETFTAGGRFCQYDVGSAPRQVVTVAVQNGAPDSCTAAQSIATGVLDTLPPVAS